MAVEKPVENLVSPDPAEEDALAELRRRLDEFASAGQVTTRLVGPRGEEVELPASAFHALQLVAHGMAQGNTMLLIPQGKGLTTQQTADLLHVSRPHVVKLLENGEIRFHHVGSHRRVKVEDALDYRARRNESRRKALDALIDFGD